MQNGLWWTIAENGVKGKMHIAGHVTRQPKRQSVADSDIFDIKLGIQGDVLSPLASSIVLHGLIRVLKAKGYGVKVKWEEVGDQW